MLNKASLFVKIGPELILGITLQNNSGSVASQRICFTPPHLTRLL